MKATHWIAVAGIAGTVLGAGIGASVTLRANTMQMQFEERTRFHDTRFEVYSTYLQHASNIARDCRLGTQPDVADVLGANRSAASILLVASPDVTVAAGAVLEDLDSVVHGRVEDVSQFSSSFERRMQLLVDAMRSEIGVEQSG